MSIRTQTCSAPQRFPGTPEQVRANWRTHYFGGEPGDERCYDCDSRPGGISATWPCGSRVPRVTTIRFIEVEEAAA